MYTLSRWLAVGANALAAASSHSPPDWSMSLSVSLCLSLSRFSVHVRAVPSACFHTFKPTLLLQITPACIISHVGLNVLSVCLFMSVVLWLQLTVSGCSWLVTRQASTDCGLSASSLPPTAFVPQPLDISIYHVWWCKSLHSIST